MKLQTRWSEPTLLPKNPNASDMGKSWRVRFDFYIGSKRFAISRTATDISLNDIPVFKERLAAANAMIYVLKDRQRKGWNPVDNTYPAKDPKEGRRQDWQQAPESTGGRHDL